VIVAQEETFLSVVERNQGMMRNDRASTYNESALPYDNTTTEFCNNLFESIESSESAATRILWRQIKPLVRGKIPYTPNTPVTQRIVQQANQTFDLMGKVTQMSSLWIKISPTVHKFMSSDQRVNTLRLILDIISYTQSIPSEGLSAIGRFLGLEPIGADPGVDWRDLLTAMDAIANAINSYLPCFSLNKFEPVDTEENLVKNSLRYIEDHTLWAAIVFNISKETSLNYKGQQFPTFISYKIRMDTDRVDSTQKFKVVDRFWSPGPRRLPLPDMKYLVFGFAYLQDMIEHGIMREQHGIDDIGVRVQQFPYPCYIDDKFTLAISRSMPMFMIISWIFTVAMIVKSIVMRKSCVSMRL